MKNMKILFVPQKTGAGICILILNFSAILGLALLAQTVENIFIVLLCSALFSTRLKCLNNIIHECSHNSFSRGKKLNECVGKILSSILLTDYAVYKAEHLSHHRYLGDYEKDIDFSMLKVLRHDERFTFKRIFQDASALRFIRFYFPRVSINNRAQMAGASLHLLIIATVVWLHFYVAAFMLIFGFIFFFTFLKYLTDVVDHGGLYVNEVDELYKSRNFIVNNIIFREISFPRNDCYHLVHHLYPYLPVKNFKKAHELLMQDLKYKELNHHWRSGINRILM